MQNVFNEVFWEERWALQNYDYKFPVVGLVDYQRVLQQLAGPEEVYRGKKGSGFAAREQRRLASEAIQRPIVDKDEGLWYTSGIERFISTMETSALMGKNVARLVVDGWLQEASLE